MGDDAAKVVEEITSIASTEHAETVMVVPKELSEGPLFTEKGTMQLRDESSGSSLSIQKENHDMDSYKIQKKKLEQQIMRWNNGVNFYASFSDLMLALFGIVLDLD